MKADPPIPRIHRVKRRLKSGDVCEYHYAERRGKVSFWTSRSEVGMGSAEYWQLYATAKIVGSEMREFLLQKKSRTWSDLSTRAKRAAEMLRASRRRAAQKGWTHSLSVNDVLAISVRQNYRCAISDLPLDWEPGLGNALKNPFGASLDRISSAHGYTLNNVRLVLTIVNFGMSNWGQSTFEEVCAAVAQRTKRGEQL